MRKFAYALMGVAIAAFVASGAIAKPPGWKDDPTVGKKLYNFNVVVFPGDDFGGPANDVECGNAGHRIFFNEDGARALGVITWSLDPGASPDFVITDCDGTVDDVASVVVDERIAFWVGVRLVGPAGSSLDLICDDIVDVIGINDLCILDGVTVKHTKSSSFTKVLRNVVEDEFEDVTWTLNNSMNAKILQVWIMEDIS